MEKQRLERKLLSALVVAPAVWLAVFALVGSFVLQTWPDAHNAFCESR